MAAPTINFAGFVFDDSGSAVSGATVHIYDKNTSTTARESSSITTNSSGYWSYSHSTAGEFDVEIVKGTSKRRFMFDDKLHLAEIDVEKLSIRGNEGAIAGLYMYADDGDDVSDQWLIDAGTDGVLAFGNDANSQGVFVDHVTFTPNSTVASSTAAFLGNVTVAAALTSATIDATTDFTIGSTVITDDSIVMTPSASDTVTIAGATNGILNITTVDAGGTAADVNIDADGEIVIDAADAAGSIFKIAGTAQLSIIDGSILPTTDNDIDLGSSSYQFKDAYINGTLEADAITIGGTNVVTGSLITTLGTISAGVWQGTAIASGYIAADAITGAKIADDAIDSEHYTDGSIDNAHIADDAIDSEHYADASIDFAHIQNVAANSILGRNANSSGVLSEVALATTQILIGDGTGFTAAALSGDATMTNAGVVSLAAAQTSITSMYATGLILGQDAQTAIDFGTSNEIDFKVDNAARLTLTTGALYPVTDNQIDLGTSSLEFKDAYFDGTVTADAFAGPLTGNVTGNASGTALTVTQAAQTAITSLGDLTALTVDDVVINGKVITMTGDTNDTAVFTAGTNGTLSIVTTDAGGASGNIQITADGTAELAGTTVTLDSGTDIVLDANGADVIFKDDGTTIATLTNSSSDFVITTGVQDKDFIVKGDDGGSAVTAMTLDMSDAGAATLNNGLTLSDGNLVVASGHGVDFSLTADGGGSMTGELLDDYEEGTWTPVILSGGSAMSGQNLSSTATYVKVGSVCHVQFDTTCTAIGTGNSSAYLSGLPFTAASSAGRAQLFIGFFDGLNKNVVRLGGDVNGGGVFADLYDVASAADSVVRAGATDLFQNSARFMGSCTYTTT